MSYDVLPGNILLPAPKDWDESEEINRKYLRLLTASAFRKKTTSSVKDDHRRHEDDETNRDNDDEMNDDEKSNTTLSKLSQRSHLHDSSIEDPLQLLHMYDPSVLSKYSWMAATSQNGDVFVESDKFNPRLFLATKHHSLKYENLGLAKRNLKQTENELKMKMIILSEKNIHKFTEAKNAIDALCSNRDAKFRDGSVNRLDQSLMNVQEDSERLFEPLIQRKKGKCDEWNVNK